MLCAAVPLSALFFYPLEEWKWNHRSLVRNNCVQFSHLIMQISLLHHAAPLFIYIFAKIYIIHYGDTTMVRSVEENSHQLKISREATVEVMMLIIVKSIKLTWKSDRQRTQFSWKKKARLLVFSNQRKLNIKIITNELRADFNGNKL